MTELAPQHLNALAIFPLPNAVLFPGAMLPLHVFEPRYRELAADTLAGERMLAIARLRPGYEADYEGRPPVYPIAGVGYIVGEERLDDGRFNLLLRGVGRVRIVEELPATRSYRLVRARRLIDSHTERPDVLDLGRDQMIALCQRIGNALGGPARQLVEMATNASSPSACADMIAAAIISNADHRQELLEALDPADRIELLVERLVALLRRLDGEMLN